MQNIIDEAKYNFKDYGLVDITSSDLSPQEKPDITENLGIGVNQAIKLFEIPESDYPKYRRLVKG